MSRLLFAWARICRRNIQILAWRLLSTVAPATPRATTASAQHDGLGHVPTNEEATTQGGSTDGAGTRRVRPTDDDAGTRVAARTKA